jgi:hypothetical protein
VLELLYTKAATMLAEIFMVRVEAKARVLEETPPLSNSRFTPFIGSSEFKFKDSRDRLVEAVREKASTQSF